MTGSPSSSLWYKDAIVYELHVKAFRDSDGDGTGDFRGLIEKLDYLEELGITALWLLPFYPSPMRDDGYDIADYRGVHPTYGTLRDFKALVREAHRRGMKVITELVINHTSDQHPWFQAARRARPGSAKRDVYVWSESDTKFPETRIIFTDTESSNWAWDPVAGAYYWHRFFSHQPDLNLNNPKVVREVGKVLRFWLDMGVDGLRLDAVPYLCVREGTNNENLPETHEVIRELRRLVDENYSDRMLLAEANQWPEEVRHYFGDGDECHMAFHFPLMPRIFMALRREDSGPIRDIMNRTPEIPESCQWALFLRNHDELTLEMVTDDERDYMYREYASDPRMRVNAGIRRRLAPLVDNDRRRIELLNSLLFSFPGTPVIYYGDELGMGDNIYLGDRDGVRTPMQWSVDRNAGFTTADPARLYLPVNMDPVRGYQAVNVEAQQLDSSSLLHFMKRVIALRRQHKAFGRGTLDFVECRNRTILAYLRRYRGEVILAVANLSRYVQPAELDLSEFKECIPLEIFGHTEFPRIGDLPYFLTLGPHSFYWFRLEPPAEPIRVSTREGSEPVTLPVVVLEGPAEELFGSDYRYTLANDIIAAWLPRQRWFQGKGRTIGSVELEDGAKMGAGFYLTVVHVRYSDGAGEHYAVPVKIAEGNAARRVAEEIPESVLARIRTSAGDGVLFDALADRLSCGTLFSAMSNDRTVTTRLLGQVRGFSIGSPARLDRQVSADSPVHRLAVEQSNTSVVLDDQFILKFFRRIERGPNPDLEIGRYLTEHSSFANVAPLAGGIEYLRDEGPAATLALLQSYVPNRGDGWSFTLALLKRYLAGCRAAESPGEAALEELVGESVAAARLLGRRTAEFHRALGGSDRSPAFAPEPISSAWLHAIADEYSDHARGVLDRLQGRLQGTAAVATELEQRAVEAAGRLILHFESLQELETTAVRIRCHGDYHLGQVLRVDEDFVLLDFEGEPLRSVADRRRKLCALQDVAGMLRSYAYAARTALGADAEADAAAEMWVEVWESRVRAAFVEAYVEGSAGANFLPDSAATRDRLLLAFEAHKAFYEVAYELSNRPDWIAVPLRGILDILKRSASDHD